MRVSCIWNHALVGRTNSGPRKRPSLRYGRKSVSRALVAPMHMNAKVHGHASPIKMYATQMCNGCTIYKMQLEWCIRHSCTPTVTYEARPNKEV
ncbi:hypothetical protein EVAR_17344_1 [Eumeta japonica]|uniref:Uncharacterized protein n=1 Tax=Eumeta variegata TaxID=151549 RepID=A0A4C1WG77_EUMVA|nr:hypothetical protein EVAR_17344_1 [Eumeta japonica]